MGHRTKSRRAVATLQRAAPGAPLIRRIPRRAAAILPVLALLLIAAPAAAHVDLDSSAPADGGEVDAPLDEVVLRFTETMDLAGDGATLLAESGTEVPATVTRVDETTIVIEPAAPLDGGEFAVTWTVRAGDAHPRSGAITFSVADPASGDPSTASAGLPETVQPEQSDPADSPASEPEVFASLAAGPSTFTADWLGRLARWSGMLGMLLGVGALLFGAAMPLRSDDEVHRVAYWIRRSGLLVLASVPLEIVAQSALLEGGSILGGLRADALAAALGGSFGWAILLRAAGAAGLLWGTQLSGADHPGTPAPDAPGLPGAGTVATLQRADRRLDPTRSPLAVAGSIVLLISYLFDGHTVTASPGLLVRLADLVHIAAAAAWVGGVAMLAAVLHRRWRDGAALGAGLLGLRFSSIASAALAAVGAAGAVLTWTILDSPGDLISTGWGRALILKLLAVGVAAGIGAYNHFVVLPALAGGDGSGSDLLRRTVRIEAAVLVAVVAITAILTGAAS